MKDTPSDTGRSAVVSRDVRACIKKAMPPLLRIFLGSDRIVEYLPVTQEDEQGAAQATDYMNSVIFTECDGPKVVTDALHDCLKNRNAAVTWWHENRKGVSVSSHSGLNDDEFAILIKDDEVEVLEHTERMEDVGGQMTMVHDAKIKRVKTEALNKLECFPLEQLLIHPDAIDEDTAPMIGRKRPLRRSDLVAMGYDKDVVWKLPKQGADGTQDEAEELSRRTIIESGKTELATELEEIDYFSLLVRIDMDGDGIAELRRMCFGGKVSENTLLENEEADEVNYGILATARMPHQWEGVSISDDVMDLQRVKTVLLRQTLDGLYWANNQQIAVRSDMVENMDAVTNPQFGQVIQMKAGAGDVRQAIQPINVPFVAKDSFAMMAYVDDEIEERTGVTDASGGVPPDALQNVTAKASALMEQQGIGQVETMARTFAHGLKRVFAGLLRMIIKHQDKPRMVRLRNEWVTFDPRQWNAGMDCSVNVGLGAGSRERDLATMGQVLGVQREILTSMGLSNPYVTPENFGNALVKFIEATGLRAADQYVSKPQPEQIQQMMQNEASKPNPEIQKIQAQMQGQMQMKQMELQQAIEIKQIEAEKDKQKEIVQSQAAVEEALRIAAIQEEGKEKDRALEKHKIDTQAAIEREKLYAPMGLDASGMGPSPGVAEANQRYEMLLHAVMAKLTEPPPMPMPARPKRVTTPDGETFIMEEFDPPTQVMQ